MPVYALFNDKSAELITITFLNASTNKILDIYLPDFHSPKVRDSAKTGIECAHEIIFSMDTKKYLQKHPICVSPKDFSNQVDSSSEGLGYAIAYALELVEKNMIALPYIQKKIAAAGRLDKMGNILKTEFLKQKVLAAIEKNIDLMFLPSANYHEINSLRVSDVEFDNAVKNSSIVIKYVSTLKQAFCEMGVFNKAEFSIIPMKANRNKVSFRIALTNEPRIKIYNFSIAVCFPSDQLTWAGPIQPDEAKYKLMLKENQITITFDCKDDYNAIKNDEIIAELDFVPIDKKKPVLWNSIGFNENECTINNTSYVSLSGINFNNFTKMKKNPSGKLFGINKTNDSQKNVFKQFVKNNFIKAVILSGLLFLTLLLSFIFALRFLYRSVSVNNQPSKAYITEPASNYPSYIKTPTDFIDDSAANIYLTPAINMITPNNSPVNSRDKYPETPKLTKSILPSPSGVIANKSADMYAITATPSVSAAPLRPAPSVSAAPLRPAPSVTAAPLRPVPSFSPVQLSPSPLASDTPAPSGNVSSNRPDEAVDDTQTYKYNKIAAGNSHSAFLKNDGTVVVWGDNRFGQTNVPAGLKDVVSIAAGADHTVALKKDGTVVAWGYNYYGQCNIPEGLSKVKQIATGICHTVALKEDGTVVAWGDNFKRQCNIPENLSKVKAIAASLNNTVVLREDGTVIVWGYNFHGEWDVPDGLKNVRSVAAGSVGFIAALKKNRTVVVWGSEYNGVDTVPATLNHVKAITAGWCHIVALKEDGTVVAWGDNNYGQLNIPSDLKGVAEISSSCYHTLALKDDGSVVAWGDNRSGQLDIPPDLQLQTE